MALITLIGLAAAASQLGVLDGIANTVLATSAITAIVVGFAARATLANSLAGLVLTITQPLRVGDQVRIGEHEGVVEDVTLSATTLRTILGTTIRLPNELITQSVVYNDTIDGSGVVPEATVLLPYGCPLGDAVGIALALPACRPPASRRSRRTAGTGSSSAPHPAPPATACRPRRGCAWPCSRRSARPGSCTSSEHPEHPPAPPPDARRGDPSAPS